MTINPADPVEVLVSGVVMIAAQTQHQQHHRGVAEFNTGLAVAVALLTLGMDATGPIDRETSIEDLAADGTAIIQAVAANQGTRVKGHHKR